jgi:hypothetical protein
LRLLLALLALFALPACTALRAPDELPEDPAASLQQLHWLAGDWRRLDAPAPSGERWWHDGPLLRGEAWVQDGKRRLRTERLTIEVDGERLVYRVEFPDPDAPDGVRSRTEFTLVELARRAVAFENREHGHPWRITYVDGPAGMEVSLFFDGDEQQPSRVERLRFVRASR